MNYSKIKNLLFLWKKQFAIINVNKNYGFLRYELNNINATTILSIWLMTFRSLNILIIVCVYNGDYPIK